jgi:hypothetical protein
LHGSFEVARDNLQRTAPLSIRGRTLREMVENQGRAVVAAQQSGSLPPAFTAADCTAQTLITGADGVMVPRVTEPQKCPRRETESAQRIQQGRPRKGSDGPFQEFQLLAFYDPDKAYCHVVGTADDHEALGRLMRREARHLGLAQAKVQYAVSDGAEQWREDLRGCVGEQGSLVLLDRLGPYRRTPRTGPKHEALESLRDYVGKRVAMTDYPTFRRLGYDCGSGPTESLCGRLTDRLKGPGMRWDTSNAEAMMALASLYHSGLWDTYWKFERAAA